MFILIGLCRKCWCSLKKIPAQYGTSNQVAIPYDELNALENNTKAEMDKIFQDKLVMKVKRPDIQLPQNFDFENKLFFFSGLISIVACIGGHSYLE